MQLEDKERQRMERNTSSSPTDTRIMCFLNLKFVTHFSVLFCFQSSQRDTNNSDVAHPGLGDSGEDGSADHAGVGVELQVIQQQAGGQQHGRGVCRVAVSDALPGVPGALHIEERVEFVNGRTCWDGAALIFDYLQCYCSADVLLLSSEERNTFLLFQMV